MARDASLSDDSFGEMGPLDQCPLHWYPLGEIQVVEFARIPVFADIASGTLASSTTKLGQELWRVPLRKLMAMG
ncbi:hypothetical protein RMSM_05537 [Rhodopirellula maiorica SM1]|uniref:Uncharacterized protein n=1 Tax=Rhodopirellula maiorica SM1 TaxID=1265738 RepID=M5RU89_9BACT|nr:hypothetical protein RMSM_05537 [Rhodopirellula maiorica SM1]